MFKPIAIVVVLLLTVPVSAAVVVSPAAVKLDSPEASQQLLVTADGADGTRAAKFSIADPKIAAVDTFGKVTPKAEGQTEIVVVHGSTTLRIPLEVTGLISPPPLSFENDIVPILTKASCNSGGCHGKAEGQAGFKLSVFGFDPEADHRAITTDGRGRRLFPASAANSLILLKGAGIVPHGGGKKLDVDGLRYRRLLRWIQEGASFQRAAGSPIRSIEVEPKQQTMPLRGSQQLRVTAIHADGTRRGVTAEAEYSSNAETIAAADGKGLITAGNQPGEAAILVRYLGQVTVCRVTLPRGGVKFERPPETNFIDKHVWNKLELLGIPPSALAEDPMFLRRVFLDVIGTLPTSAETTAFLADTSADKRSKLIDTLLARPEYAEFWAMKWADILKVDKDVVTPMGAVAMTRWLKKQFASNRPYDQFARAIVTASGSISQEGPAAFFRSLPTPETAARGIGQLFLGVRIECAECHHHPSEKWAQDDYWALAGMFSGVGVKPLPGSGEAIIWKLGTDLGPKFSKSGTGLIAAKPLGASAKSYAPTEDRRVPFAEWMTAAENPFFAQAIANRIWAHYFGRGLVEPIDDIRATNPASNEPLLAALAQHLKDAKYDLKAFTKSLLLSRAYQLSSATVPGNAADEQNFSHAAIKPIPAEVLLDAVSQVSGSAEKFNGWPAGYRAIQIWDNRMPSYFFRIFGRPVRYSVCECERGTDPSISQALHLMNSSEVMAKIRDRAGAGRKLADSELKAEAIIDAIYLSALSRKPTGAERKKSMEVFDGDRRAAVEDVIWAVLNSKEFLYNR